MKKLLSLVLILFSISNAVIYTSMCPDWSSALSYSIGKCVSMKI